MTYFLSTILFAQSQLPDGYEFVDAGILLAQGNITARLNEFMIDSAGFKTIKLPVTTDANHQYMYSINGIRENTLHSARAYLIVKKDNLVMTIYSDNAVLLDPSQKT